MTVEESVFLTLEEAQEAVCIDFDQYGPQPAQMHRVMDILGVDHPIPEGEPLGGLVRSLFTLYRPDAGQLLDICTEVFWARARQGRGPAGEIGLFIPTDMECFHCTRCGKCCRSLDFHRECLAEDVALWREKGRDDILEWVGQNRDGDYLIWVRPGTDLVTEICPWLEESGGCWTCSIHDLKPEICREYPGSGKHAYKTGCPTANARCHI
mgnify:FL=1